MTEDFKNKILKYLTGNIQNQSGSNEPQFQAVETITNNLDTYIWDNYGLSVRPYIIDIIKGNFNDNYLVYGRGSTANNTFYGFIIILDSNFQIIESTNQYSSGTIMNQFLILNQAPNGNFYGIDTDGTNYRFIMLNNMLSKTPTQTSYRYVMQKTYNITSNYPSNFSLKNIIKNLNASKYLIYGSRLVSGHSRPCAIEYTVNVGIANEWVQYDYSIADNHSYGIGNAWASWDTEGNLTFRLIGGDDILNSTSVYEYENSSSAIALKNTYTLPINTSSFGYFDGLTFSATILNETNIYILAFVYGNNNQAFIYRVNNGTLYELYKSSIYSGILGNVLTVGMETDYINTYFWYLMPITQDVEWAYYGGLITGDNVYQTTIYQGGNISQNALLNGYNQFNLYSITLQAGDTLYVVPFVFNQFNYNGLEYEDINCLKPNSGILYDDNDKIIFARNLYNLNVNGATTISTIEIPNTFLNDVTIENKSLFSQTNVEITTDSTQLTKNLYEVVDINFFNTLVMKNSNNPNNEIINNIGASRLNTSMSQILDYTNATANKIRINYQDGTSLIQNIGTPTITNGVATYTISIYVPKGITNIEIISNDEITTYQTIVGTFGIGKYYTLTQDVRVE